MRPEILDRVEELGFVVFDGPADYDLNIIGVRNPEPTQNTYDDRLHVVFKDRGNWTEYIFTITTEAGRFWLENGRSDGTACLVHPQQIRGCYRIGLHRGQYDALVQNRPVKVWRDANKDSVADWSGDIDEGIFGINIHRSSAYRRGEQVGRYSAGCQVFADPAEFLVFMQLCKKQIEVNGWLDFTYTLILGDYDDESTDTMDDTTRIISRPNR